MEMNYGQFIPAPDGSLVNGIVPSMPDISLNDRVNMFQNDVNAINPHQLPTQSASVKQSVTDKMKEAARGRVQADLYSATPIANAANAPETIQAQREASQLTLAEQARQQMLQDTGNWHLQPPSDSDITEGMWEGSFLITLMVAAVTGNVGQAMAAGGLAALNIHDEGYARQERGEICARLAKDGYSEHALYEFYTTGKNDALKAEADRKQRAEDAEANRDIQRQQMQNQAAYQQGMLANSNLNTQINAGKAGYDLISGNGELSPDVFKALERTPDGRTSSKGATGVYQITQGFWDQYKPSGAPSTVSQASDADQRAAVQNYINQAKEKGYTTEQIVVGYQHGLNPQWINNPNWEADLAHSPQGREYLNYYRTHVAGRPMLVANGHGVGGAGLITATDGAHQVETTRDGAPKQYVGDNGEHYYVDVNTGQKVPTANVMSNMTPGQVATQNLLARDLAIINKASSDAFTPIVGQIQGGGLGSPAWGAGFLSGISGEEARSLYQAANEINGMMLTRGVGAAKAMGASGINTKEEAEMYFAAMPRLDFSSEDALRESAKRIKQYTDDWNSSYGVSSSSSSVTSVNTGMTDSKRAQYGY